MTLDDRLTVLGRAVGSLAPDRIEWTLTVREEDQDPRAAFRRCAERLRALAGGLAVAEVTTGAVTVYEHTERGEHGVRKPTGRHMAQAALTASAPLEPGARSRRPRWKPARISSAARTRSCRTPPS